MSNTWLLLFMQKVIFKSAYGAVIFAFFELIGVDIKSLEIISIVMFLDIIVGFLKWFVTHHMKSVRSLLESMAIKLSVLFLIIGIGAILSLSNKTVEVRGVSIMDIITMGFWLVICYSIIANIYMMVTKEKVDDQQAMKYFLKWLMNIVSFIVRVIIKYVSKWSLSLLNKKLGNEEQNKG